MDIEILELRELAKNREQEKVNEWMEPFADPNVYCLLVLLGLVLTFFLSGCQRTNPPLINKHAQEGRFKAHVYSEGYYGNQGVSLQWFYPKERPLGWFVRRTNLQNNEMVLYVRDASAFFLHDEKVPSGRYQYRLYTYDGHEEKEIGSVHISVYPMEGSINE